MVNRIFKKHKRGYTLAETVIAIGLFAIILAIVLAVFRMSINHIQVERDSYQFQQGIDDFIYNLSVEMKSAVTVEVSGDDKNSVLTIAGDDFIVFYEANNLRGSLVRSQDGDYISIVEDFKSCTFHQEDDTSFTLIFYLTEDDMIRQTFRCGCPTTLDPGDSETPPVA